MQTEAASAPGNGLTRRFRDAPIKQKLMVVTVLTAVTVLLLAGIAIFSADMLLFRANLQRDTGYLATMTAENTTAALQSDDTDSASKTLAALKVRPHLISACLYSADGSLFARYLRPGSGSVCQMPDTPATLPLPGGNFTVTRPVMVRGRRLGTVVLYLDTGQALERMRANGITLILVLLASTIVSVAMSSRLGYLVATPMEELARVSAAVSETRDFSIRAPKRSNDELGTLVDTFNQMLSDIQSRDIELRKALGELQESNLNLERSNADLERFAFVASHDLQEPLRMMSIFSQLLAKKYARGLDPEANGFIDNIVTGAHRMQELLTDLLEYTRLGSSLDAPVKLVDLNAVLRHAEENLAESISSENAVVSAGALPSVAGVDVHFIPLFQNLIGNALKYRSAAAPRIDIRVSENHQNYRFEVADNGIGIAPEYHKQIFVVFKRLHGKEIPGTGIGLAICHRIVERYGGQLWVESAVGKGSTFIFLLPKPGPDVEAGA